MNDDGQITGGLVRYMQRVKTGDYEHKEVAVELSFIVRDGMDHRDLIDRVGLEAQDKACQLLGLSKAAARLMMGQGGASARNLTRPPKPGPAVEAATPGADTSQVQKVDDKASTAVVTTGDPALTEAKATIGVAEEDPLEGAGSAPVTNTVAGSAGSVTSVAATADPTAMPEEDEFSAARVISDSDLTSSCTKKNAELIVTHKEKGTQFIRDLVANYVPVGKGTREIPANKRQEFLDKLNALK